MKNKFFKINLVLLLSIFSVINCENEIKFDKYGQPLDSESYVDPESFMKAFVKVRDRSGASKKNPYYVDYYKYLYHPQVKNNPNLNEELLENFNKWGDSNKLIRDSQNLDLKSPEEKKDRLFWIEKTGHLNPSLIIENPYRSSFYAFESDRSAEIDENRFREINEAKKIKDANYLNYRHFFGEENSDFIDNISNIYDGGIGFKKGGDVWNRHGKGVHKTYLYPPSFPE